jgi:hypothetical protein
MELKPLLVSTLAISYYKTYTLSKSIFFILTLHRLKKTRKHTKLNLIDTLLISAKKLIKLCQLVQSS